MEDKENNHNNQGYFEGLSKRCPLTLNVLEEYKVFKKHHPLKDIHSFIQYMHQYMEKHYVENLIIEFDNTNQPLFDLSSFKSLMKCNLPLVRGVTIKITSLQEKHEFNFSNLVGVFFTENSASCCFPKLQHFNFLDTSNMLKCDKDKNFQNPYFVIKFNFSRTLKTLNFQVSPEMKDIENHLLDISKVLQSPSLFYSKLETIQLNSTLTELKTKKLQDKCVEVYNFYNNSQDKPVAEELVGKKKSKELINSFNAIKSHDNKYYFKSDYNKRLIANNIFIIENMMHDEGKALFKSIENDPKYNEIVAFYKKRFDELRASPSKDKNSFFDNYLATMYPQYYVLNALKEAYIKSDAFKEQKYYDNKGLTGIVSNLSQAFFLDKPSGNAYGVTLIQENKEKLRKFTVDFCKHMGFYKELEQEYQFKLPKASNLPFFGYKKDIEKFIEENEYGYSKDQCIKYLSELTKDVEHSLFRLIAKDQSKNKDLGHDIKLERSILENIMDVLKKYQPTPSVANSNISKSLQKQEISFTGGN